MISMMQTSMTIFLTMPLGVMASGSQAFSLVTSSIFTMILWPTNDELSVDTSTSVENALEVSLLRSSTTSTNFDSLFDIDIVLLQAEWTNSTLRGQSEIIPHTTLLFEAHAKFYKDPDSPSPPTSKFALDSLVVRTFSQPSSKGLFLEDLMILKEQALDNIEDADIAIVEDTMPEIQVDSNNSGLPGLDLFFICFFALGFVVIIYIFYKTIKDAADRTDRMSRALRRHKHEATAGESEGILVGETSSDKGTGPSPDKDGSDISNDEYIKDISLSYMVDENIDYRGDSHEVESAENQGIDCPSTPTVSNVSSVNSSSVATASSIDSSPPLSLVSSKGNDPSIPGSPYRLGAPPALYPTIEESSCGSSEASPLTARLLRLPMIDSKDEDSCHISGVSPESAPAVLMNTLERNDDDSDVKMTSPARSTGPAFQSRLKTPWIQDSESRESTNTDITEIAVASSRTFRTVNSESQSFKKDWDVSKKRAMEEDTDGSDEDVFCIEIDTRSNANDGASRMSGLSAVSEWLKSIRVVGSPDTSSHTNTSHTSAEHSSVEPNSPPMEREGSVDGSHSLERSLAASIA